MLPHQIKLNNEINNAEDAQGTKDNNKEINKAEDAEGTTDKKSDDNQPRLAKQKEARLWRISRSRQAGLTDTFSQNESRIALFRAT